MLLLNLLTLYDTLYITDFSHFPPSLPSLEPFSTFCLPGILKFHNLVWYRPFLCVSLIFCFFLPGSYYSDVGSLRLTRSLTFFPSCFAFSFCPASWRFPWLCSNPVEYIVLSTLFSIYRVLLYPVIPFFTDSISSFHLLLSFITPINSFFLFCFIFF